MANIKELFEEIIADGVITRDEHDEFIEEMHADGKIDEEEQAIISRLFNLIREGKVTIVDDEREKAELKRRLELQEKMKKLSQGES